MKKCFKVHKDVFIRIVEEFVDRKYNSNKIYSGLTYLQFEYDW